MQLGHARVKMLMYANEIEEDMGNGIVNPQEITQTRNLPNCIK